eukprot:351270-Lingulodinium_polyedra.AAC.1
MHPCMAQTQNQPCSRARSGMTSVPRASNGQGTRDSSNNGRGAPHLFAPCADSLTISPASWPTHALSSTAPR